MPGIDEKTSKNAASLNSEDAAKNACSVSGTSQSITDPMNVEGDTILLHQDDHMQT